VCCMPFGIQWLFGLGGLVRGVRVALRVSRPLFEYLVHVAWEDGFSRAMFWQLIILLGWVQECLALEKPEAQQEFLRDAGIQRKVESVGLGSPFAATLKAMGKGASALPIHRGPERHRLGGSKIILVRLPGRLLVKMDRHARLIGATRTNILNLLLERGLVLYLRSQLAQAKTHHQALKTASAPDSSE